MDIFQLFIVQPIFNLLIAIYSIIPGRDFGVAIIVFTILIRFAMWPLVKKQLHQTKAMQKMQPELARIKKQAKGNKQLEGVMMMELYKKHDINPFRSIGVLVLQLPIFIALYQVIQIFTLHRDQIDKYTYVFLKGLGPVQQLIQHPETFNNKLFGLLDLTKGATTAAFPVNLFMLILAVVAAGTQYVMAKQIMPKQTGPKKRFRDILGEASQGKQSDQSDMTAAMSGSMTKFLPVMMFVIIVNLPGAIALYYTVSNLVAMLQQRRVLNEDTDEMIEIADEEPVEHKKATAKARAKVAREGNVIRITAKDNSPIKPKRKEKS